jgi:two-component system alkaline phosphatase synthesis response regulator PhoP
MAHEDILAVAPDEDILELLRDNLSQDGYQVTAVTIGGEGLPSARSIVPDLMLPGADGREVCRQLKLDPRTRLAPIIMLTIKGEEVDIVTGQELGADDCLTKRLSTRVLLARVQSVFRRRPPAPPGKEALLKIHDLVIDPGRHEVLLQGKAVALRATEFRLLHLLARWPGLVLTRSNIVEGVHGNDYPVTARSVDVLIVALRKKLGPAAAYIETVRGVGYRFKE